MTGLAALLHGLVGGLLPPVIGALLLLTVLLLMDLGVSLGERFGGTARHQQRGAEHLERLARTRVARADLLARVGPTLGLMGTLIPLGPGIAAMGRGDFATLSVALNTAFDTTVLGLLIGLLAYLIGRWRRVHYDRALAQLEAAHA